MAVNAFVLIEALYLLNCRSLTRPARFRNLGGNPFVPLGIAVAVGLQFIFTYAPFMHGLFGSAAIAPAAWLRLTGAAMAVFCAIEVEKRLQNPGKPPRTVA